MQTFDNGYTMTFTNCLRVTFYISAKLRTTLKHDFSKRGHLQHLERQGL